MSHRLCRDCKQVVDNRVYNEDYCPVCFSNRWADPTEHNNEWALLYKQQQKLTYKNAIISIMQESLLKIGQEFYGRPSAMMKEARECLERVSKIAEVIED